MVNMKNKWCQNTIVKILNGIVKKSKKKNVKDIIKQLEISTSVINNIDLFRKYNK